MAGVAVTYPDSTDSAARRARLSPRALRARFVPPFAESRLWGWIGPIAITLLAGYLRFNRLQIPSTKAFDEVYYTHDAHSLLHHGVELNNTNDGPGFIVHPPLGKWMIAVGEWIVRDPAGTNSFGWRLSAAIVGTLSVLIVARTARRMTRSTLLGCVAGLLMCLDGLEFVQSRTAMLDIFLMFWVVVAFACLILDRDQMRARLASRALAIDGPDDVRGHGPRIGMRWWLLACGISLGAASACKWDGAYYIPAFAALAMFWTMGAKRAAGVRKPFVSTAVRDLPGALFTMAVVPVIVYVASWTGWFLNNGRFAYDRNWANGRETAWGLGFVPAWIRNPVRGLWHYHWEALNFHTHLESYHKYRSNAWGWLFENRPVLYYADYPHADSKPNLGCKTGGLGCARMIYNMGTPAIWWASIPVMLFMLYLVFRRDWRASAVLVPFLFGYLPWLFNFKRTMFFFYALPLLPFICIALAITIGYLLGPREASPNRRMAGAMVAGSYLLIVVVMFFYFLPIMSERTIPFTGWQQRMWFQSWSEDSGS
jgi:dolichyl-phosphate-mannose-protein mannosyltransferase